MRQDEQTDTGGECRMGKPVGKHRCKPASADSNLASVVEAWPDLPKPIKSAIMAMVRSTQTDSSKVTE